jgi:hypothetical protein
MPRGYGRPGGKLPALVNYKVKLFKNILGKNITS